MSNLTRAVAYLRPGVDFANIDGSLAGIRWDTPDVVPPSQAEVDRAVALLTCRVRRAAAYPAIGDALDAIAKGGAAFADWQAACRAIKESLPKPATP